MRILLECNGYVSLEQMPKLAIAHCANIFFGLITFITLSQSNTIILFNHLINSRSRLTQKY